MGPLSGESLWWPVDSPHKVSKTPSVFPCHGVIMNKHVGDLCISHIRLIQAFHYNDVIMGAIASQITSLTIVYSIVYSDADQRKHQSSASLVFVRGIHRDRWIPRTNGQLHRKYSIWWRHHAVRRGEYELTIVQITFHVSHPLQANMHRKGNKRNLLAGSSNCLFTVKYISRMIQTDLTWLWQAVPWTNMD